MAHRGRGEKDRRELRAGGSVERLRGPRWEPHHGPAELLGQGDRGASGSDLGNLAARVSTVASHEGGDERRESGIRWPGDPYLREERQTAPTCSATSWTSRTV